jgi:hypothetical protein
MPPSVRMIPPMGACCQRVVDHAERARNAGPAGRVPRPVHPAVAI